MDPEVSIIISHSGNTPYVRESIRQIWQNVVDVRYEVVVVDNNSEGDPPHELTEIGDCIRVIRIGARRFLGESFNIGAEHASGAYLFFLTDSIFVQDNCLSPMMETFRRRPQAGVVGPGLVTAGGLTSARNMLVDGLGHMTPLNAPESDTPAHIKSRPVDFVPIDAMLVRKADFVQAGGFDLAFEPAGYEDADLCFRLRAMGREIHYCGEAQVTDVGSLPAGDEAGHDRLPLRDINRDKFVARWKGRHPPVTLRADVREDAPDLALMSGAAEPPKEATPVLNPRRMVAILTPYPLTPGGGERVVLSLAAVLGQSDLVHLVTPHRYSNLRVGNLAREFGIAVPELKTLTYDEFVTGDWDLTIVLGNEIFPRYPAQGKRSVYICQFPFPMGARTRKGRKGNLSGYERILTYSEYARAHTIRSLSKYEHPPVEVLFPPAAILEDGFGSKKEMILSVGRFGVGGHGKRQDLMIGAFRRLRSEMKIGPDVELHLAGATQPTNPESMDYVASLMQMAEGLPVKFHLDAPKETLLGLYRDAAVYWHATGFGVDLEKEPGRAEHFGIAIVEAMSAKCVPVVFGAGGPAEIVTHGVDGFLFGTEDELVDVTQKLMSGALRGSRNGMGRAARRTAMKYSPERFADSALGSLGA